MDIHDDEILNFWRALHKNRVLYIMIGGFAVNMHGYSRMTADLDIWIKDTVQNRQNLRKSIKDIELGDFEGIESTQFIPGWTSINLNSEIALDIMTSIKGFDQIKFDGCYNIAPTALIENIPVKFLHYNQLIEAKKASGRLQDLLDIEQLEKNKKGG